MAISVPRNLDIRLLPAPVHVLAIDIPQPDNAEDKRHAERENARSKADSVILTPSGSENTNRNGHTIAEPKSFAASKASALIDMFREHEQRSGSPAKSTPTHSFVHPMDSGFTLYHITAAVTPYSPSFLLFF
ncbi:hypothetical protein C8R43DRAFT_1118307 [Mycena crocata]|nr:hypothetical protein C8R43DRAFT_1118307 [Mycena crocata]